MRNLAVLLMVLTTLPALAADSDVPEAIQGRWVDESGSCKEATIVSATTLVYPDGTISDVVYSPEERVFRIREEAVAYEYVEAEDQLILRPEGFGMGSAFVMNRCQERTSILQRRCGWLANLTPGNWFLVDADAVWTLSAAGEEGPEILAVMDMVPDFDRAEYVSTGDYTGYGCICMTVSTDGSRITAIASVRREPLATCKADPFLPAIIE